MNRKLLVLLVMLFGSLAKGAEPTRRALLVGVTTYPHLSPRLQLEGPANDVLLMRTTLVDRFAVLAENVVVLSEAEGTKQPDRLPTRAHIHREFKRLAEIAQPGDEVIIHLVGHGSQQPESPNRKEPKIDGLDELFLPRDVGRWDDAVGSVENVIVCSELGEWLTAIQAKKAFVWLIIDACHSGTMMRGSDDVEKSRRVETDELKIPRSAITAAEQRAATRTGPERSRGEAVKQTSVGLGGKPGIFAMYAAQQSETTPERPMPMRQQPQRPHGIFTFAICQVLTQAKASGSPISYRELGQQVQQQYYAWGRSSPTPMVEYPDTDPDREVLGPGVWKDRSKILLTVDRKSFKVNVGQLLGLTPGSILQVIPPAGMGENLLGHVKVTASRNVDSDVESVAYEKTPAPMNLPDGARCKVVFVDYGETQLKVAVAIHLASTEPKLVPVEPKSRAALLARLTKTPKPNSLYRIVDDPKVADWLIAPSVDGCISLLPARGWDTQKEPVKSKGFGPVPTDERLETWLEDALGRISRAEGLLKLATDRTHALVKTNDSAPKIKVELSLADRSGNDLVPLTDLTVYDKDRCRMKVTNIGNEPFDLTILYLNADHAIDALFPKSGVSNRVGPKNSFTLPLTVSAKTVGTEHLLLIAVKSDGQEVNFTSLTQKAPDKLREIAPGASSPLVKLLDRRMFGSNHAESVRGVGTDAVEDHAMSLISWQVKPESRLKTGAKK